MTAESSRWARGWMLGCLAIVLALGDVGSPLVAQELEPRAYRPLPVGLNFGLLTYSYSSGNVLVDATAPVDGLDLDLQAVALGYLRTFPLLNRSASLAVFFPYIFGSGSATLNGEPIRGDRAASADMRFRASVNLIGGPALTMSEFAKRPQGRSLGVGLVVSAPTGQYNSNKVVNFGANRWGFKPEIGYSHARNRWIIDLTGGVWFLTDNDAFIGGQTKEQDPIGSFQAHLSYTFRNGSWLALNGTYFTGGRTTLDGVALNDLQENTRVGLTYSIPLGRRDSVKLSTSTGAFTSAGADFDIGSVAYQRRFGGPEPQPAAVQE